MIRSIWTSVFLPNRLFYLLGVCAGLFVFSFFWPILFVFAQLVLFLAVATFLYDIWLMFHHTEPLTVVRKTPDMLTLGDELKISIELVNETGIPFDVKLIDELPYQLDNRHFSVTFKLPKNLDKQINYTIRPTERGEFDFGKVQIYLRSPIGLVERKFSAPLNKTMKVFPSVIQMKHFELTAFSRTANISGVKKIRRIGHSYEFEQIKNYVTGDDYRSINWKATSRHNQLMVNQYEDERSQHVYCIIDKSRSMKMPFNGLTLMDHAINTALVISNIALKKYDKAGLVTFSDRIGAVLQAERSKVQMKRILETLYNEKERPFEANYELLYNGMTNISKTRSLLFLFTNFESILSIDRVLPILRRLNKKHLLVVVFFENTEITDFSEQPAKDLKQIFLKVTAQGMVHEKVQIVQMLRQFGIQTLLTKPDELSLNTVNKYLELKSRGLI